MALTAGTWFVSTQVKIQGAAIAPQGNASGNTLPSPVVSPADADSQTLAYGTASGKADILCAVQNTLAATTAATYDLLIGTDLKNVFGQTAAFAKLRGIVVVIDSGGDASGMAVGGAASNATPLWFADATDKAKFYPSGPPFAQGETTGITIDATHKALKIENLGAAPVTFTVFLAGSSV